MNHSFSWPLLSIVAFGRVPAMRAREHTFMDLGTLGGVGNRSRSAPSPDPERTPKQCSRANLKRQRIIPAPKTERNQRHP